MTVLLKVARDISQQFIGSEKRVQPFYVVCILIAVILFSGLIFHFVSTYSANKLRDSLR